MTSDSLTSADLRAIIQALEDQGFTNDHPLRMQLGRIISQKVREQKSRGAPLTFNVTTKDILAARDAAVGGGAGITISDPRTGPGVGDPTADRLAKLRQAWAGGTLSADDVRFALQDTFGFTPEQVSTWVTQNSPQPGGVPAGGGVTGGGEGAGAPGGARGNPLLGPVGATPPGGSPTDLQREAATGTEGGREFLFQNFLAGSPQVQALNPFARQTVRNQFDPLQAQFGIQGALSTLQGQHDPAFTFRDFLSQSPGRFDPQQAMSAFQQFAPLFGGGQLNPNQQDARDILESQAQNIIGQFRAQQVSPLARQFALQNVGQRIGAFQDQNLEDPIFGEFVRRGFSF
jgi:hypothetical protein